MADQLLELTVTLAESNKRLKRIRAEMGDLLVDAWLENARLRSERDSLKATLEALISGRDRRTSQNDAGGGMGRRVAGPGKPSRRGYRPHGGQKSDRARRRRPFDRGWGFGMQDHPAAGDATGPLEAKEE